MTRLGPIRVALIKVLNTKPNPRDSLFISLILSVFIPQQVEHKDKAFNERFNLLIGLDANYRDTVFRPALTSIMKDWKLALSPAFWDAENIRVSD